MKKMIWLLLSMMMILLAGCDPPEPSPVMFKLAGSEPKKFPAEVTLDYFISNKAKGLVGDDRYITLINEQGVRYHQIKAYPVEKKEAGYVIHRSKHERFTLPDIKKFGYSDVYRLEKQNGQIKIIFPRKNDYRNFFIGSDSVDMETVSINMEKVCLYYDCYKKTK